MTENPQAEYWRNTFKRAEANLPAKLTKDGKPIVKFAGKGALPEGRDWYFVAKKLVSLPEYIKGTANKTVMDVPLDSPLKNSYLMTCDETLIGRVKNKDET